MMACVPDRDPSARAPEAAGRGDLHAMVDLGEAAKADGDLEGAEGWYRRAAEGGDVEAMERLGYLLRRRGELVESRGWFRQAAAAGSHDDSSERFTMRVDQFESLVATALDSLPEHLGREMENVAVIVDDLAPVGPLLGLYEGVPLTKRGMSSVHPDRITIFMQSICARCTNEYEVAVAVRRTVLHEVAHHFGIDDDRLRELGWG
jgi:predicted Zn-dependent protease with MMP-like domain